LLANSTIREQARSHAQHRPCFIRKDDEIFL
jgi:hypothetical protein